MLIGQKANTIKAFTQEEVIEYAKISGDTNPIHFDEEHAKLTKFGKPIVPGLLVASLFGGLLGSKLPGNGTIHIAQTLSFKKPVFINENVNAVIEILSIREDKPIITFKVNCIKENGDIAITGESVVMYNGEFFK